MLLVHCRVRIVPSERRAKSVRRRTTVVDRRTPILAIGQTRVEAVRSRSDRRARLPNHRIPAHVFRGRELRRRQRQTHVSDKRVCVFNNATRDHIVTNTVSVLPPRAFCLLQK